MSIHIYKDETLTQQVSEGDMTSPDTDLFDGTAGESRDRELFVANEQTALAQAVDAVTSEIPLALSRFADDDVIIIDSEEMRVLSGGGTTTLTVQRGIYGTAPDTHAQDAPVYSAVNCTGLAIEPVDTSGTDESAWCALALSEAGLGAAVPGEALALGDKTYSSTISFWRRITVPAGTPLQNKIDIKLRLTATLSLV